MKKELKHFIMGASTMAVLMGGLTFAANRSEMVERIFRDIKIKLNGTEITPKDATGKVVEPFIIDGTTYLPVRAVGEAMGLNVDWDDKTSTVDLDDNDTCESFSIVITDEYIHEFDRLVEMYKFSVNGPYGLPPTLETWLFNEYIETRARAIVKDMGPDFNWNIDEKFMVGENKDFISVLFKDDGNIGGQYFFNVSRKTGKFLSTKEVLNMINVSDEEITNQYNTILKKALNNDEFYNKYEIEELYNKYKIESYLEANKPLFVDKDGEYYGVVTKPISMELYDDVYNMKNGERIWPIPGV